MFAERRDPFVSALLERYVVDPGGRTQAGDLAKLAKELYDDGEIPKPHGNKRRAALIRLAFPGCENDRTSKGYVWNGFRRRKNA